MEERIQKILSRVGYGSRRSCEELISAGRIKINGQPAILGSKADPAVDKITVDGKAIPAVEAPKIYIALNKPRGVLSDEDPQDSRPTVRDLVEVPGHLFTVGRLDLESEGLILLTNDGEIANKLTHPRYGHEKEYKVLVSSRPDEKQLKAWRLGVVMEDGYRTAPAEVEVESLSGKGTWLRVILREGKKRQIREVGKLLGLHVVKLTRIRIGGLLLGNLKPREWRYLTPQEVEDLTKAGGNRTGFSSRRVQKKFLKPASRSTGRKASNYSGNHDGGPKKRPSSPRQKTENSEKTGRVPDKKNPFPKGSSTNGTGRAGGAIKNSRRKNTRSSS